MRAFCLSLFCALLLAACSSGTLTWPSSYHVVQRGDTLYSISFQYGVDYRVLARWNNLGDGTLIREGQIISLVPTEGAPVSSSSSTSNKSASRSTGSAKAAPPLKPYTPPPEQKVSSWQWPTSGKVVAGFGRTVKTESGIRIGGKYGQPIERASGGTVLLPLDRILDH